MYMHSPVSAPRHAPAAQTAPVEGTRRARGGALRSSTFEDWSIAELYELAIVRRVEGRALMTASELARALVRLGPRWRGLPVPAR